MKKYFLIAYTLLSLPLLTKAQNIASKPQQDQYTIKIQRATDKIQLDGQLQEAAWQNADVASDFWISFPVDDKRADKEVQTEVRVTYDDNFLYVGAICYGPNDFIIPSLKRDAMEFWSGDVFVVLFDPVNESTNGVNFGANPAGVQYESLISGRTGTRSESNSGAFNPAWDNKWYVEVQQGTDRWTVEMAIPFKTLRFDPEKTRWGINFTRGEPRSNAWHCWSPVPVQFLTMDLGYTGAMDWDTPPAKIKSNISLIPYALTSVAKDYTDNTATDWKNRIGGDAKVAVTSSLNLDLTLNPDFSQVDVDEQVTNLTTFNIRFPERRLFFLENSDLFSNFGIPPMRPFFSRKIGLDEDGGTIPILYGARLSGNISKDLRVGASNLQTKKAGDFLGQNYTSLAMHQQVLGRSTIKAYFNNRTDLAKGESSLRDYNRTTGLEFNYLSPDAKWQGFGGYGLSFSDGLKGDNYFYNVGGGYDGRIISAYFNFAGIGDNYYADMGWNPSADFYDAVGDTTAHIGYHHSYSRLSYSLFPKNQTKVYQQQFSINHIADVDNSFKLIQNRLFFNWRVNFANSSRFDLGYSHTDNQLLYPFSFTDDTPLPVGRYHSDLVQFAHQSDTRKYFSALTSIQFGKFYGGNRLETAINTSYRIQPWGNFGLNFAYNKLIFDNPYGNTDLFLIGPKVQINFSRDLFWTTFLQYNTQADNFNINSRLQWRFQPLSDFFLVYSDNYALEIWGKKNRALVLKVNYWLNL